MPRSDYWIKVFDSLPGHWKVRHIQEAMNWNRFETVGFLVMFWLQVASDAPDGVLDRLVSAGDILDAIGLKDKTKKVKNQFARVVEAMLEARLLETEAAGDGEAEPAHVLHDWEDGGGKLQKTRTDDTLRQRGRRTRAAEDDAPACHADVTRESKSKSKETPPYPPQAGGEFPDFQNLVLSTWTEECARVPVRAVNDNKTKLGVGKFARQLQAGEIDPDAMRLAMREFLSRKYGSDGRTADKCREWNLNTLANSPGAFLPREKPPPPAPAAPPAPEADWLYRCGACGFEMRTRVPESEGRPEPERCMKSDWGTGKRVKCPGMMHVVEKIAEGGGE